MSKKASGRDSLLHALGEIIGDKVHGNFEESTLADAFFAQNATDAPPSFALVVIDALLPIRKPGMQANPNATKASKFGNLTANTPPNERVARYKRAAQLRRNGTLAREPMTFFDWINNFRMMLLSGHGVQALNRADYVVAFDKDRVPISKGVDQSKRAGSGNQEAGSESASKNKKKKAAAAKPPTARERERKELIAYQVANMSPEDLEIYQRTVDNDKLLWTRRETHHTVAKTWRVSPRETMQYMDPEERSSMKTTPQDARRFSFKAPESLTMKMPGDDTILGKLWTELMSDREGYRWDCIRFVCHLLAGGHRTMDRKIRALCVAPKFGTRILLCGHGTYDREEWLYLCRHDPESQQFIRDHFERHAGDCEAQHRIRYYPLVITGNMVQDDVVGTNIRVPIVRIGREFYNEVGEADASMFYFANHEDYARKREKDAVLFVSADTDTVYNAILDSLHNPRRTYWVAWSKIGYLPRMLSLRDKTRVLLTNKNNYQLNMESGGGGGGGGGINKDEFLAGSMGSEFATNTPQKGDEAFVRAKKGTFFGVESLAHQRRGVSSNSARFYRDQYAGAFDSVPQKKQQQQRDRQTGSTLVTQQALASEASAVYGVWKGKVDATMKAINVHELVRALQRKLQVGTSVEDFVFGMQAAGCDYVDSHLRVPHAHFAKSIIETGYAAGLASSVYRDQQDPTILYEANYDSFHPKDQERYLRPERQRAVRAITRTQANALLGEGKIRFERYIVYPDGFVRAIYVARYYAKQKLIRNEDNKTPFHVVDHRGGLTDLSVQGKLVAMPSVAGCYARYLTLASYAHLLSQYSRNKVTEYENMEEWGHAPIDPTRPMSRRNIARLLEDLPALLKDERIRPEDKTAMRQLYQHSKRHKQQAAPEPTKQNQKHKHTRKHKHVIVL